MNKKRRIRVYLDYNIYVDLSKKLSFIENREVDIFYSVAHVEEYYKAKKNATEEEDLIKLDELKRTMKTLSKRGIILNPSKTRIKAKSESFEECYQRIETYDTRDIVEVSGNIIYKNCKQSVNSLHEENPESINNSNLSYEEIWNREEVKRKLAEFPQQYANYLIELQMKLFCVYGSKASVLHSESLPEEFCLTSECLKKTNIHFDILAMIIEFLNNVLCLCGYNKDKTRRTTQSGIHDVSHMIYATYCDFFVTNDAKLRQRVNAIYYYLGLETRAISIEEYNQWK